MFLRQLTLKGFKSFADTTVLGLEPGVTVVVGPNGSGKSNIVDAVAWVLGAQAPSSVRSQKMDDVIFAGTAKRPALGRAEVSLTIDNSAGLLPIEFTEVTLTRTLWRSGDSEYAINGVPCRLLDVQDLLSDSGVGRQQHTIVSQGQIDGVLSARPEDRRAIIEEAAGVLKYRKRKERAERRLDSTEGNLLRVQDLLREVRRQLRPLERQAEAARRYGEVMGELGALRVHLAGRDIAALRRRIEALAGQEREGQDAEARLRSELAALDTEVLAAEAQLGASGASDIGDTLVRVEQLRERARGLAAVLTERRRSLERDRVQLMDASVAASLEADAAQLRAELAEVASARRELEAELASLADAEEAFATRRASAIAANEAADADRADPAGGGGPSAASAASEVRGELRTRRDALRSAAQEADHLARQLAGIAERGGAVERELEGLRAALTKAQEAEAPLVEALAAAEARRAGAEAELDRVVATEQEAAAQHAAGMARAEALVSALDAARARAGAARLSDVAGVLGTLLDLVEIDDGWEAAFEAAAGEALATVVVEDPAAARRALEHLHGAEVGGGVLAAGAFAPVAIPLGASPAGGEPVRGHVHTNRPSVAGLLDVLLAGAVAVPGGWRDAADAALDHPDAVVVTKAGDRFSTTGWRLGLGHAGATAKALEDARRRGERTEQELAQAREAVVRVRAELAAARLAEDLATRRLDTHDTEVGATADAVARFQTDRRELEQARLTIEGSATAARERHGREAARVAELEEVLVGLEAAEVSEAQLARLRNEARLQLEEEGARLAARRRDAAVAAAGIDQREALSAQRLAGVERRLAEDTDARADAGPRVERVERSVIAVDRLARLVDEHRVVVEARWSDLREQRRRQSDEARAATARLEVLRRDRAAAERTLAELGERQRRVELDATEARLRLEVAVESLRRDLDTEPEAAMVAEAPPLAEGVTPTARVRDLEREIRIMGPINPLALEEFTALQERHQFLEEQLEDVRNTRRELQRVVRSVDAEIRSVFATAFADVSESFAALFTALFPGGSGRLVLTEPDDLLNTGIEVEAKPSGKNVKKLSLLSGGERSLTALAFLFAVFRSRPSPFYVMDEVEAALDDVNLHRFLSLLDEFRAEAQLLVVSHQKRTMEAADCLIGVTMAPGGSSKVISERVTSAV